MFSSGGLALGFVSSSLDLVIWVLVSFTSLPFLPFAMCLCLYSLPFVHIYVRVLVFIYYIYMYMFCVYFPWDSLLEIKRLK